jgi:hypothetical protein
MRCREAIRRLNNGGEFDNELIAHLRDCPKCARAAQAARMLDIILTSARGTKGFPETSFSDIRAALLSRSAAEDDTEISFMSKIKNELVSHPKVSLGMIIALTALAFITLVPVSYNKTIGYSLAISNVRADERLQPETLNQVIETLGYDKTAFEIIPSPVDDNYIISNKPNEKAMIEVALALETLTGEEYAYQVTPIVQPVTSSIISQIKDKILTIRVKIKDKTDDEIARQIKEKLKAVGYDNLKVFVQSDPDVITIRINSPDGKEPFGKRIDVIKSEGMESFELFNLNLDDMNDLDIDMEGKTDKEIIEEIKGILAKKGFPNATVKVKLNDAGEREIIIDIKDIE